MRKLLLVLLLLVPVSLARGAQPIAGGQDQDVRRVNVPYFSDDVRWADVGIFWFGRVDPPGSPGQNYADVRVAYTAEELLIYVNVEDYYIWYDCFALSTSDLTQYDAVAVYLDTAHDRADTPMPDDYSFLSGLCLDGLCPCEEGYSHRRQARGTGTEWATDWQGAWTDGKWASWWCNPGPNSNDCSYDFGWWSYIHIPWSTLGFSGPPPEGTVWGLSVILYDRDDLPPAGAVAPQNWPEDMEPNRPETWAEMHFGTPTFLPPPAVAEGTTVIRRGLGQSLVEDSWVGGGGSCAGGHEGDPEHDNFGADGNLFVANQERISDFPCFSKSFLRFYLDPIPDGKVIISATLSLHHWSNARWDGAQSSLIWLFAVDGEWGEYTLTWNNAPLARENLSATWVDVITPDNFPGWPGVRYDWEATQAVAEAYAVGEPVNIAVYTADINHNSSKYFKASETGDWNEEARPTLTLLWGERVTTVDKRVQPAAPRSGEVITYTTIVVGNGHPLTLTDALPDGVSDPGSIHVTMGNVVYSATRRRIEWIGTPTGGHPATITFPVTVQISGPVVLANTAILTDAVSGTTSDTAIVIVDGLQVYLPLVVKK